MLGVGIPQGEILNEFSSQDKQKCDGGTRKSQFLGVKELERELDDVSFYKEGLGTLEGKKMDPSARVG